MGLLIPCSKELVGSNPTPRAYLRVLCQNNKRQRCKNFNVKNKLSNPVINSINGAKNEDHLNELLEKITLLTNNCSKSYFRKIITSLARVNINNASLICEYLASEETQFNIKTSTKEGKLKTLVWLSNYFDDKLGFKEMTREHILLYLKKGKSFEADKSQSWIGTYNNRQMILLKFFKWVYNSEASNTIHEKVPECMNGIKQLRSMDRIRYKPSDMWYPKEIQVFLKYCPSLRDSAYLAMAFDTSCRPKEILDFKISSILFKKTPSGKQYAEVLVKGGKSQTRVVPLIESIPYLKKYLLSHPTSDNPDSWLFLSESNTKHGSKLTYDGLSYKYKYFYKSKYYPRLLEDDTVPEDDKSVIRSLLWKPWNLYIFRHSSLTDKSTYLKEPVLRALAGWTLSSKMVQVYIHYLGNESVNSMLEAKGILETHNGVNKSYSQTKICSNCNEPNIACQKFCSNCKMIMSYDAYKETLKEQEDNLNEIRNLKDSFNKEMKALKEQVSTDVRKQISELLLRLKPEIVQEGII